MIGTTTSVTVNLGDVDQGLAAMEARAHALGPVFSAAKPLMRADQKEHRQAKVGPEGSWAPRSAATIAAAHGKRKLAKNLLGKLPTAVTYTADATSLTAESRAKWSAAHQDGAVVGHGAKLPQRTFLWMSEKFIELADDLVGRALLAAWGH